MIKKPRIFTDETRISPILGDSGIRDNPCFIRAFKILKLSFETQNKPCSENYRKTALSSFYGMVLILFYEI